MNFTVTSFLAHTWEHAIAHKGPFTIKVIYDKLSCWEYHYRIWHVCPDTGHCTEVAHGFDSCWSKSSAKEECMTMIDSEMKRLELAYAGE